MIVTSVINRKGLIGVYLCLNQGGAQDYGLAVCNTAQTPKAGPITLGVASTAQSLRIGSGRQRHKIRALCNLYTKEPFPQSHAGEQYTVSVLGSLSLSFW